MIKLIKSTFYNENETKRRLIKFIAGAHSLSMGEQCTLFEQAFAKKQGRKYAVFVNSGSSANLILIQALLNLGRLKQGDKVGISALTWATNVMPILQLGMIPVPIDVELETLNISVRTLSASLQGLAAVFTTNVLGLSDNIRKVAALCAKEGVLFFEDNCEALGSRVGKMLLGNIGCAATFSFFVGHHLSTIEGGMVVTDDKELADMLVMVRAHGWDRNVSDTKKKLLRHIHGIDDFYAKYTFYHLAYNVRPTDIQGFLGNEALRYWDSIVQKRARNFAVFAAAAKKNLAIIPLQTKYMSLVSNFAFPVICRDQAAALLLRQQFERAKIEVRPVISGDITAHPFWKHTVKETYDCPNAHMVHTNGFYFGNNPDLTKKEIDLLRSLLLGT